MLNPISQAGGALRENHERLASSAQSGANLSVPEDEQPRPVPPPESAPRGRESLERSRDDGQVEDASASGIPSKIDLAQGVADMIQARAESDANVALIHHMDETVGTLLDVVA